MEVPNIQGYSKAVRVSPRSPHVPLFCLTYATLCCPALSNLAVPHPAPSYQVLSWPLFSSLSPLPQDPIPSMFPPLLPRLVN